MDIRHLQHLIAVADEGSFTKAARKVHIVQSGVSSSIKELEEEVGVRLIERTTRSVALTDAGKVFLQHARASLAAIEEGLQSVREFDGIVRGRLRIGVLQSLIPYLDMPLVLKNIRTDYPLLEIEVRSVTADAVPEMVRSGELDLSFHALHGSPTIPGLVVLPFIEDTLVGICGVDHPLAAKDKVSMDSISQENFVDLTPGRATRRMIDREFAVRNLHRRTVIEVGEVHTVVQFVSRGLGVAIVPSVLARAFPESSDLKVLAIADRQPALTRWGLAIVAKARTKGKEPLSTVNLFLEAMRKASKLPVKRRLRV
ncbi:MAG: LysR family transcriptional regulator [Acidobacteriaceae bacterium]|nr:LysR family transcriptional regulator [Acidobacteriaceae bacterium]